MIWIYVIIGIFVVGLTISATCYGRLKKLCKKYERYQTSLNLTGSEFINRSINILNLKSHYAINGGEFSDKYLIKQDVIVLSDNTANSMSLTAISIASHELGHAMQRNKNSALLYINSHMSIISRISEFLLLPVIIAGLVLLLFSSTFDSGVILLYTAVCFWVATIIYRLLTIPLEFNASKLATKYLIELDIMSNQEIKIAKKIMSAAAFTYVGSLFINLLKFLKMFFGSFSRK